MKSHDSEPVNADGQYALFNIYGEDTPYAHKPEENRASALPAHIIGETNPDYEQRGGKPINDVEQSLTGDEAIQLARLGLGGSYVKRQAAREESFRQDKLRAGTLGARELSEEGREAARKSYLSVDAALDALAERRIMEESQESDPRSVTAISRRNRDSDEVYRKARVIAHRQRRAKAMHKSTSKDSSIE